MVTGALRHAAIYHVQSLITILNHHIHIFHQIIKENLHISRQISYLIVLLYSNSLM